MNEFRMHMIRNDRLPAGHPLRGFGEPWDYQHLFCPPADIKPLAELSYTLITTEANEDVFVAYGHRVFEQYKIYAHSRKKIHGEIVFRSRLFFSEDFTQFGDRIVDELRVTDLCLDQIVDGLPLGNCAIGAVLDSRGRLQQSLPHAYARDAFISHKWQRVVDWLTLAANEALALCGLPMVDRLQAGDTWPGMWCRPQNAPLKIRMCRLTSNSIFFRWPEFHVFLAGGKRVVLADASGNASLAEYHKSNYHRLSIDVPTLETVDAH